MKCERCGGTGKAIYECNPIHKTNNCPDCNGTGEKPERQCTREPMNNQDCHAYNNGECMNGFCCGDFLNQPEESQDERIEEAYTKVSKGLKKENPWDYLEYRSFKSGFKSRDEEVERLENQLISLRHQYKSAVTAIKEKHLPELTAIRAQIEEMKCCGNCYTYFDSIDNCGEYTSEAGVCDNWKRRSE